MEMRGGPSGGRAQGAARPPVPPVPGTKGKGPSPRPFNPLFDPISTIPKSEPPPAPGPVLPPESFLLEEKRRGAWEKLGGGALSLSVVVHLIFILLAAFFFIRWIEPPQEKIDFIPGGGGGGGNEGSQVAHKIQQRVHQQVTSPQLSKRIASTSTTAAFTLPDASSELPELTTPMAMGAASLGSGGGAGGGHGTGIGSGTGAGTGPGSGPGVGRGFIATNPFGGSGGLGLVGTFYDFKRDSRGKPTEIKSHNRPAFTEIVKGFTKSSRWGPPRKYKHFTSTTRLTAKTFAFKGIPDHEAGKAFQCPEAGAGSWIAHYSGTVKVTDPGTYRLVGWGDNCLVVGIDGKIVLDASDIGYTGRTRTPLGNVTTPGKENCPLYHGEWFTLRSQDSVKLDIIVGDEGGIFAAGVMLEKKGVTYGRGPGGIPLLPVLTVAELAEKERALYPFIQPEYLRRTVFQADKQTSLGRDWRID
jgi:hypothetical protein